MNALSLLVTILLSLVSLSAMFYVVVQMFVANHNLKMAKLEIGQLMRELEVQKALAESWEEIARDKHHKEG